MFFYNLLIFNKEKKSQKCFEKFKLNFDNPPNVKKIKSENRHFCVTDQPHFCNIQKLLLLIFEERKTMLIEKEFTRLSYFS